MIFHPRMVELILSHKKTQTRRPTKGKSCRYRVGKTYAVQPGRTKKGVARIRVIEAALTRADAIDDDDARAEGFESRSAFLLYWTRLYPNVERAREAWELPVWRIEFTLCHVSEPR